MSVWMQGGYPVHLFLDRVSEHWICGICNNVIRSSVSTKCGHVFCFSCIRVWVEKYGTCPFHCGPADMSHLNLVPGVDQEIESQFIKCPRYKFGCHRILRVGDLILHEKVCTNSPSPQTAGKKAKRVSITIEPRPGEALGFHVAGGEKLNVSNVVKGLPADRAGLRAGDRILEVNSQSVRHWTHQDAVNLIRRCSTPLAVLVERDREARQHVYEEIDQVPKPHPSPNHSHQPSRASDKDSGMGRSEFSASSQLLSKGTPFGGAVIGRLSPSNRDPTRPSPVAGFGRNQDSRMSMRTEAELVRSSKKTRSRKPSLDTVMQDKPEENLQDVTLHRSAGTRLGITLGFDQNKRTSKIYVLHLLPDGIAAQDGRLKEGDVIVKINGFEVHDTEEALLLFLEQEPSITITVSRHGKLAPSVSAAMRRVDSCGSLDSHTHHRVGLSPTPPLHISEEGKQQTPPTLAPPTAFTRVLSPQEARSPLKHFALHRNQGNRIMRGSPRRGGVKETNRIVPGGAPVTGGNGHPPPSNVMHLRTVSAPETQV